MKREVINNWYMDHVLNHKDQYTKDYLSLYDAVAKSKAIYKGKPIPFLYMPKFYTDEDLGAFNRLTHEMMQLCRKMIDLYHTVPAVRKLYGFDTQLEQMILKRSPYHAYVPMARFDIFYQGPDDFMFCELNTDGTSAMNEDMVLADLFGQTAILEKAQEDFKINSFELFDTWVHETMAIFKEVKGTNRKPTVAIVDFIDKGSSDEFKEFALRFEKAGCKAIIVDPRDLTYDGALYADGKRIDVVYRRLVTRDMMDRLNEIPAFEAACMDDITVVIGNIQSQVVHTKAFFSLLHHEVVRNYLTKAECAFIDKHVPETHPISVVKHNMAHYVHNKDGFLIKPLDHYASIGVVAGEAVTAEVWETLLKKHRDDDFVIQSYCKPVLSDNITYDPETKQLVKETVRNITGLFLYNEKLAGVYSRAGRTAVISGLHDVFTMPTFYVSDQTESSE